MATTGALPASGSQRPCFAHPAAGTTKPTWPAKCKQILPAGLPVAEPTLQLGLRARIILDLHNRKRYRLGLPESNGYPVFSKIESQHPQACRSLNPFAGLPENSHLFIERYIKRIVMSTCNGERASQPVLRRPAAMPLMVAAIARCKVSLESPARLRRNSSTWIRLMGST